MPLWQWLLDAAGVLLGLALIYGIALVIRRRVLSRHGGTFEMSYRVRSEKAGRGWLLGLGRYSGDDLEWFRFFSLSPLPKRVWRRSVMTFVGKREPGRARRRCRSTPITWWCGARCPTATSSWRWARPR